MREQFDNIRPPEDLCFRNLWYSQDRIILKKFRENYVNRELDSILKMIDGIYDKDVKNPNEVANKYGIELDDDYKGFEDTEGSDNYISYAFYSPNDRMIHICLTVKGSDSIVDFKGKDDFKSELIGFFVHEDIHKQQDQGKNSEQPYIKMQVYDKDEDTEEKTKERDWKNVTAYISQKVEVDAFARSIAEDLKQNNININTIFKVLPTRDNTLTPMEFYYKNVEKFYKNLLKLHLRSDNIMLISIYYSLNGPIWRRFLRRLYYFLPKRLAKDS